MVSGSTTTTVKDAYQLGHLAYQTDGSGTMLATFAYDAQGVPTSVTVGSDPTTAPRYYYVYNGHGDVLGLVDATGTAVATYAYDTWGVVTVNTESFSNGWHNPYLYDGRDGVRYDTETSLYWMSVRAYDPSLGRFIARDPLGRAPLMGWTTQPYAYAGNNPLRNVDPSGQRLAAAAGADPQTALQIQKRVAARVYNVHHSHLWWVNQARGVAAEAETQFYAIATYAGVLGAILWGLSAWLSDTVVPWLLGLALLPGLGTFIALAAAAAVAVVAGLFSLVGRQLLVIGSEAAVLGALFAQASINSNLSLWDVKFGLKGLVVATLAIGTIIQYLWALRSAFKTIDKLIGGPFSGWLLSEGATSLTAGSKLLATITDTGTTSVLEGGLGILAFSYLYRMEGDLS